MHEFFFHRFSIFIFIRVSPKMSISWDMPIQVWNKKWYMYITSAAFSPSWYKLHLVYSVLHLGLPKQMWDSVQLNFKPFKNARIFLSNARKSVLNISFKMKMSPKENTWPVTSPPLTVTKPFTRNLFRCPLNRGLKQ